MFDSLHILATLAQPLQFWIILDILLFCLISIAIAIPIQRALYDEAGRLKVQRQFFVNVSPFNGYDFIGVGILAGFFGGAILYSSSLAGIQALSNSAEAKEISLEMILSNSVMMFVLTGNLLGVVGMRANLGTVFGFHPFKIHGNDRIKKPKEWAIWVFLSPIAGFIVIMILLELYQLLGCLLYTSPSPRDGATSRMPSSA